MGAADLLAMADTLRATADEMESVGVAAKHVRKVREAADDCDQAAYHQINLTRENAA